MDVLYFKQIQVGYMANFAYLIGDKEEKVCAIVDPAWDVDLLLNEAKKDGMKIVAAILTHTHFDHCNGLEALVQKVPVKIYVHAEEAKHLKEFKKQIVETGEGYHLSLGKVELLFLHTPGHTEGAQCVLVGNKIITGDTLFVGACGRCDLPGGDEKKMTQSLQRLASLDGSIEVFPGHAYGDAESTTIGNERRTNAYMQF